MTRTHETTTAKGTLSYDDAMYLMDWFNEKTQALREGPLALSIHATWNRFGDRRIRIECQSSAIGCGTMDDTIDRSTSIIKAIEDVRRKAWFEGYEVAKFTKEEERTKKGTLLRTDAEHITDEFMQSWNMLVHCMNLKVNAYEDECSHTLQVLIAIDESEDDLTAQEKCYRSSIRSGAVECVKDSAWFKGYAVKA